jgi:hypothetical protein
MINGLGLFAGILALAVFLMYPISLWKLYVKAGEPGWAALIPIYNLFVWIRIARRPEWWIVLLFIPVVNAVMTIVIALAFAKQFGKDWVWGIGTIVLGFVFYPLLAFGDAEYQPEPSE